MEDATTLARQIYEQALDLPTVKLRDLRTYLELLRLSRDHPPPQARPSQDPAEQAWTDDGYQQDARLARWQAWLAASNELAERIMARRQGHPLEIDILWQAARTDLEGRDEQLPDH